jgi:hypothetical protein
LFEAASELVDDGEFIGGDGGHEIALDGLGDRAEEYEALFDRQLFDGLLEFGDLHGCVGGECGTLRNED